MSKLFDARGLSCPEPVLMVKKALDDSSHKEISIIVDNEASMENVSRFLASRSFEVKVVPKGIEFEITGKANILAGTTESAGESGKTTKYSASAPSSTSSGSQPSSLSNNDLSAKETQQKIMVFAATDRVGFGDDELGKKLMVSFIKTIKEMGDDLWMLVFVNNGVKLTIEGSLVLEDLLQYEADGIKIMVCGTCLTHFNLLDAKKVGETTNMLDIVSSMQLADKVIKI
ncbi:MAG: sulfurtransferase-like selenium metabolism protein YedF [Desulfamplus sp.]|nr:sulfurtransferase-like selenium metabolism protein YedF [Desulfamplus sp.]